jgi:hypothetical protein
VLLDGQLRRHVRGHVPRALRIDGPVQRNVSLRRGEAAVL